jgi:uncharacterized protein involved in exopolysaccharide biosynthesis
MPSERSLANDGGIKLMELFFIARKHWLWLLAGLLFGALTAMGYVALSKPTYESRASIRIGKVHDFGMIEEVNSLLAQLTDEYGLHSERRAQGNTVYLKQELRPSSQNNILKLVAVGHSPEETRAFLDRIVLEVMQRHEHIFKTAIKPLQQRAATIERQIRILAPKISELGEMIDRLRVSSPLQASATAVERSNLDVKLNQMEFDRVILEQRTARPYSNLSEVEVQATLPDMPVAPKKMIIAVSGGLFGLSLGLLAAFVRESFENERAAIK